MVAMSDLPQRASPDLHAIFGIDGEPTDGREPVISVEREGAGDPGRGAGAEDRSGVDRQLVDDVDLSGAEPDVEVEFAGERQPPVEVERELYAVELAESDGAVGSLGAASEDESPARGAPDATPEELS